MGNHHSFKCMLKSGSPLVHDLVHEPDDNAKCKLNQITPKFPEKTQLSFVLFWHCRELEKKMPKLTQTGTSKYSPCSVQAINYHHAKCQWLQSNSRQENSSVTLFCHRWLAIRLDWNWSLQTPGSSFEPQTLWTLWLVHQFCPPVLSVNIQSNSYFLNRLKQIHKSRKQQERSWVKRNPITKLPFIMTCLVFSFLLSDQSYSWKTQQCMPPTMRLWLCPEDFARVLLHFSYSMCLFVF